MKSSWFNKIPCIICFPSIVSLRKLKNKPHELTNNTKIIIIFLIFEWQTQWLLIQNIMPWLNMTHLIKISYNESSWEVSSESKQSKPTTQPKQHIRQLYSPYCCCPTFPMSAKLVEISSLMRNITYNRFETKDSKNTTIKHTRVDRYIESCQRLHFICHKHKYIIKSASGSNYTW